MRNELYTEIKNVLDTVGYKSVVEEPNAMTGFDILNCLIHVDDDDHQYFASLACVNDIGSANFDIKPDIDDIVLFQLTMDLPFDVSHDAVVDTLLFLQTVNLMDTPGTFIYIDDLQHILHRFVLTSSTDTIQPRLVVEAIKSIHFTLLKYLPLIKSVATGEMDYRQASEILAKETEELMTGTNG